MTEPNTQTFRMIDPEGKEIMSGSLPALMEHLPDTPAREAALDQMLKTAAEAVAAEEQRDQAIASTAQMITDAVTRLTHRLDAYITRQEEQQRQDEEQALRKEQEEIQRTLDQLPDPDAPDDPLGAAGDDDQLTIHPAVDPERYGPGEDDAEEPTKPVLSYPPIPLSYIKGKRDATADLPEGVESLAPAPLGTDPIYDPADLGHPRSRSAKQVPPPVDVSLHEE
jgi:hypothetical protein